MVATTLFAAATAFWAGLAKHELTLRNLEFRSLRMAEIADWARYSNEYAAWTMFASHKDAFRKSATQFAAKLNTYVIKIGRQQNNSIGNHSAILPYLGSTWISPTL
jgi:hypothetical protein